MCDAPIKIYGPTGEPTWIDVMDNILTMKQLKETAVKKLPRTQGQTEDNVQLIVDGKTMEDSTPLFGCKFLSLSSIHLVLKVHGG